MIADILLIGVTAASSIAGTYFVMLDRVDAARRSADLREVKMWNVEHELKLAKQTIAEYEGERKKRYALPDVPEARN